MFIRELQLVDLDKQCEIMNELFKNPAFHPLRNAELVHENHYTVEFRWEDDNEVVTNVVLKKDGLCWRSMVSRIPRSQKSNQKM